VVVVVAVANVLARMTQPSTERLRKSCRSLSTVTSTQTTNRLAEPDIHAFATLVEQESRLADYPHAATVEHGAVVYDTPTLRESVDTHAAHVEVEIARALSTGPGIVVFRRAFNEDVVDRVSEVFRALIAEQRATNGASGDHFGKPGANDRIWNALEKLAINDPAAFVAYYANDMIALGARAWLGPMYQMTSQVNVVNPGGAAQMPHRDYHLGFMTDDVAAQFPPHVHRLSPYLTLQGAVAHSDMPIETGPTLYLANSHRYEPGYLAWRRPEFIEYFDKHRTQVPLCTGDLVYFNPALFHAAGTNVTTDIRRMANLLQVNSAFGRAMESVDRLRMSVAIYPELQKAKANGVSDDLLANVIASCAEGYAFPTNLDRDQPVGRLTPESQSEILQSALTSKLSTTELEKPLHALADRQRTN
jgi:ectoine hydroxylase-related dioxygenase (phytanoyl-CoA dioxygenase family)